MSTILSNFIALRQPTPEISLTTNLVEQLRSTRTEKVNDISPECLLACGDKKLIGLNIVL